MEWINSLGHWSPLLQLTIFLLSSFLMIWRLGIMEGKGFEGTVLGTLVMPYCSGLSNLLFAFILGQKGGDSKLVLENCVVNNVTNLTLLIGLPTLIWGMNIIPRKNAGVNKKGKKQKAAKSQTTEVHRLNKLSLLLTLLAVFFFTGAFWSLSKDQKISDSDAYVLIGLFIFWQIFHIFDVIKYNIKQKRSLGWSFIIDILLIVASGYFMYISIEALVEWVLTLGNGFLGKEGLGWLSGWLMVLPNAMLAIYYTMKQRPDIAYSSQIGDAHICIPLCIGLYAIFQPITMNQASILGLYIILSATLIHLLFVAIFGRLPKWVGAILTLSYAFFVYQGTM